MLLLRPKLVVLLGLLLLLWWPAVVAGIPVRRLRALLSEERLFEERMTRSGIADEAAGLAFAGSSASSKLHGTARRSNMTAGPEALTCIAHTGLTCSPNQIVAEDGTTKMVDRCSALTGGPAECRQSRCECATGFCSDSYGQCSPERSELLPQTFRISPEQHPKSIVKMGATSTGEVVLMVTADEGKSDPAAEWRVVVRTDGTHLITTMAYPNHVVRFVKECEAVNLKDDVVCHYRVEAAEMWEASTVGTQLSKYGWSSKLMLHDVHSSIALYFDLSSYNYGLGCYMYGHDCPTEASWLVFDPPLPTKEMQKLTVIHSWSPGFIIAYSIGTLALVLFCLICWKECCLNVKGTRFAGGGIVTRSGD